MKYDKSRLRIINQTVINRIRQVRSQNSFDPYLPLYASYLYATVAHARGHLHMKHWNKWALDQCDVELLKSKIKCGWGLPALGFKFETLEDQTQFLEICRLDLERAAKYNTNIKDLPLAFPAPDIAAVII